MFVGAIVNFINDKSMSKFSALSENNVFILFSNFYLPVRADVAGIFGGISFSPIISFRRKKVSTAKQCQLNEIIPFKDTSKIRRLAVYQERTDINLATDARYSEVGT